jgi:hypothetical protein
MEPVRVGKSIGFPAVPDEQLTDPVFPKEPRAPRDLLAELARRSLGACDSSSVPRSRHDLPQEPEHFELPKEPEDLEPRQPRRPLWQKIRGTFGLRDWFACATARIFKGDSKDSAERRPSLQVTQTIAV